MAISFGGLFGKLGIFLFQFALLTKNFLEFGLHCVQFCLV